MLVKTKILLSIFAFFISVQSFAGVAVYDFLQSLPNQKLPQGCMLNLVQESEGVLTAYLTLNLNNQQTLSSQKIKINYSNLEADSFLNKDQKNTIFTFIQPSDSTHSNYTISPLAFHVTFSEGLITEIGIESFVCSL